MPYDPLTLCTFEKTETDATSTYQVYRVEPDVMYPATVDYIVGKLAYLRQYQNQQLALEAAVRPNPDPLALFALRSEQVVREALAVPKADWELTSLAFSPDMPADVRQRRERALEAARLWFTRALHLALDQPVVVHIVNETPAHAAFRL